MSCGQETMEASNASERSRLEQEAKHVENRGNVLMKPSYVQVTYLNKQVRVTVLRGWSFLTRKGISKISQCGMLATDVPSDLVRHPDCTCCFRAPEGES